MGHSNYSDKKASCIQKTVHIRIFKSMSIIIDFRWKKCHTENNENNVMDFTIEYLDEVRHCDV